MMDGLDIIDLKIIQKNYKMKKVVLFIALAINLTISCKGKNEEVSNNIKVVENQEVTLTKNDVDKKEVSDLDFLKDLSDICVEDDGVFKNCDELFTKGGNWLFFIIIPKTGAKNWYDIHSKNLKGEIFEINNKLIDKVKKIKKEDLSKEFDIWVFNIDKKYTQFVGMDSQYNIKTPRIVDLYYLKSGKSYWEKLQSFNVKNEKDVETENNWRTDFISKTIEKSNTIKSVSNTRTISEKWYGKYSTYFSYGKIGGDNAGWGLELEISSDEIKANGEGYQISFTDLLSGNESNNTLILSHLKNISGYKQGVNMNPEFELIEDNGKFFIKSNWIDSDIITKPNKLGYEISKE
jgi:hypothetical protein